MVIESQDNRHFAKPETRNLEPETRDLNPKPGKKSDRVLGRERLNQELCLHNKNHVGLGRGENGLHSGSRTKSLDKWILGSDFARILP